MSGLAQTCSASMALIDHVALNDAFQSACLRYAHDNGSSHAIAQAALNAAGPHLGLLPIDPKSTVAGYVKFGDDDNTLKVMDRRGYEFIAYREHVPAAAHWWGPAYWRGWERRVDAQGREWTRHLDAMVTDDFGFLVPVAERAQ